MSVEIKVKQGSRGRWRFRIEDANGQILAISTAYGFDTREEAHKTASRVIQADRINKLETMVSQNLEAIDKADAKLGRFQQDVNGFAATARKARRRETFWCVVFVVAVVAIFLMPVLFGWPCSI